VVDAAGAEPRLTDSKALTLAAQQRARGDPDLVEVHLGVPLAVVVAEHRQGADDGDAGGLDRDQHHALLLVLGGLGVGLAHDDQQPAVGMQGVGGPPLLAVEDVRIALAGNAHLDVGGIGARHLGLGHRKRRADLARQQRLQPALLLRLAPEEHQQLHVPRIRGAAVHRLRSQAHAAAQDLGQRRILGIGQPRTPVRVRREQIPQPTTPGLGLELVEDRGVKLAIVRRAHLLGVDGLGGVDHLLHERRHALLVVHATSGQREIHEAAPAVGFRMGLAGNRSLWLTSFVRESTSAGVA
jgi:hypothetical protein